jgi:hypothetical protein
MLFLPSAVVLCCPIVQTALLKKGGKCRYFNDERCQKRLAKLTKYDD